MRASLVKEGIESLILKHRGKLVSVQAVRHMLDSELKVRAEESTIASWMRRLLAKHSKGVWILYRFERERAVQIDLFGS